MNRCLCIDPRLACSCAISAAPDVAVYWGNRAAAKMMLSDYKGALDDSRRSVSLDPTFGRGYHRAGKALLTMGLCQQVRMLPDISTLCKGISRGRF